MRLVALAIGRLPFVRTIELKTYDGRMRLAADPRSARPDIVLVTINEDSLRRLEPVVGRWPWPRLVHAQLLNFLARGSAKVIAYDVMFTERDKRKFDLQGEEWTGEESDAELAGATKRAGNLVHIADAVAEPLERERRGARTLPALPGGEYRLDDSVEERPIVTLPIAGVFEGSRAIGHNFVVLDPDGPLRRSVPFIRAGGRWIPSLGAAAAIQALGLAPAQVRLDATGLWLGDRFTAARRAGDPELLRGAANVAARAHQLPGRGRRRRIGRVHLQGVRVLRPVLRGAADPGAARSRRSIPRRSRTRS